MLELALLVLRFFQIFALSFSISLDSLQSKPRTGVYLKKTVEDLEVQVVLADKGYVSEENREWLKSRGWVDGIMQKAKRGQALTETQMCMRAICFNLLKAYCLREV